MMHQYENNTWNDPGDRLLLGSNEMHIWRVMFAQHTKNANILWRILSEDEQQRAHRFVFPTDRDKFIVARGMLRRILSRYIPVTPENHRFSYNPYGKPFLGAAFDKEPLQFNVSHSHDVALYAITRGRRVGIDVERVNASTDIMAIAKASFSAYEYRSLSILPAERRHDAFFVCWTRKEAYIKARGEGLSFPLEQFSVSLQPDTSAALLQHNTDPSEKTRWRFHHLTPALGYVGAIAIEGQQCLVHYWHVADSTIP